MEFYFNKSRNFKGSFSKLGLLSAKLFLITAISFLMVSCGGGGSSSNSTSTSPEINQIALATGVAQKGPFSKGSEVKISRLDKDGSFYGLNINTQVIDDKGQFSFQLPQDWTSSTEAPYIHIQVQGSAIDESASKGSNDNTNNQILTLTAITNDTNKSSVNFLTHCQALRTQQLLSNGQALLDAIQQSSNELEGVFGFKRFNELDVTHKNDTLKAENASLLLVSGALMKVANNYDISPQQLINEFADDFADDGLINENGSNWLKRMQASVRQNSDYHLTTFARNLKNTLDSNGLILPSAKDLPETINLAARPTASLPSEIIASPGETIVLDGSASFENSEDGLINFTWFRVDQQTQYIVPLSDRFSPTPSITVPNVESELLFALVVTDVNKLTDTNVIKVIVRVPPSSNNTPVALDKSVVTDEDMAVNILLEGTDSDDDPISFNITTPILLENGILEGTPPNLVYTPDENAFGTDQFTFTVSDGFDTSVAATVDITINPINDPPIANAGNDQTTQSSRVNLGSGFLESTQEITLDGSASFDIEDAPLDLSYRWMQFSGPVSIIPADIANVVQPSFTINGALNQDIDGDYIFQLIVTDTNGADSVADSMTVTVNPVTTANIPPDAIATFDGIEPFNEGTQVQLRGSESSDDGTIVSYLWEQIGTPLVTISDPAIADPTFIAPVVVSAPLSLTFRLTVTDNDGATSSDDISISINGRPTAGPVADFTLTGNSTDLITLFGSDPEGSALMYKIVSLPSNGSIGGVTVNVPFASPDIIYNPNVLDPLVADSFSFTVIDENGFESAPVIVNLLAGNNPPIANSLVSDLQVVLDLNISESITFNLTGSDPDGDAITFEIVEATPPPGTNITFGPNFINDGEVTFEVVDFGGAFEFTFRVIDVPGGLSSNIATVRIVVGYF